MLEFREVTPDLAIFDWKKGDGVEAFIEFQKHFNSQSEKARSKLIEQLRRNNRQALLEYLKYERNPREYQS